MLIEFTLGNFLSIREAQTLSMEASNITDYPDSVFRSLDLPLLRSAVIYGANSSGKSNFLKGLSVMRRIVKTSAELSSTASLPAVPFLLHTATEKSPSFFEAVFVAGGMQYRYGFEASAAKIHGEWLFREINGKEEALFIREEGRIELSEVFSEGDRLEAKTRDNALFLSIVDQFNGSISKTVMQWFHHLGVISGIEHTNYRTLTFSLLENTSTRRLLAEFYKDLDLGFEEILVQKEEFDQDLHFKGFPEVLMKDLVTGLEGKKVVRLETVHHKYGEDGEVLGKVYFNLRNQESSGTNKIVDLSGPIFDTLSGGGILVVDELDAKLHPVMTIAIVRLFNDPKINIKNAQLIFATHDTNLLSYGCFRRDQIYFIEKDRMESSELYSLAEYKDEKGGKVRKDRSFEKDYIQGRYGAIPYIGNFDQLNALKHVQED